MLEKPTYISANLATEQLAFDWSNAIAVSLRSADEQPQRLVNAIWAVNYKAKAALALTCLEWVFWRLSDITDVTDGLARLEAAWAGIVDTGYTKSLDFDDVRDDVHQQGNPNGPRQTALILLDRFHLGWNRNHPGVEVLAIMCAHLAQHIIPASCDYESWLQRTLAALTAAYPCNPAFDRSARAYDHSAEPAIPRAWFESLAVPPDAAADQAAWDTFLRGLNPHDNPYLVPADEMRANGFAGEPYRMN